MRQILLLLLFASALLYGCKSNDYHKVFELEARNYALINTPVYAWIEDMEFEHDAMVCLYLEDEIVPGQVEILDDSRQRVWWIANLETGDSASYELRLNDGCREEEYQTEKYMWERITEHSTRLFVGGLPVIQYEHPVFDADNIEETKKPFHHVFEPTANRFITKGPGGLYSHHRGIFFGYNHVYVGDSEERIDIWHARDGERSEHVEIIREFAGPVMGGHKVKIHWKDHDGKPFIEEIRDIRVFRQPYGETLIDFHSELRTLDQPVRLDGDRQHAGVQFRASQYVADNRHFTRFIRPPEWSHLDGGEEIEGPEMYDLPWNAMHFIIDERPFTVSYLSHPSNPQNAEMSERLYGRFGEFFPYRVTDGDPLTVKYRFWVTEGKVPSVESIDLRYHAFASPSFAIETRK